MPEFPAPELLVDIETRQDEVLLQLDELNGRIERAICSFTAPHGTPQALPVSEPLPVSEEAA